MSYDKSIRLTSGICLDIIQCESVIWQLNGIYIYLFRCSVPGKKNMEGRICIYIYIYDAIDFYNVINNLLFSLLTDGFFSFSHAHCSHVEKASSSMLSYFIFIQRHTFKGILSVDLFVFSKHLTKAILLCTWLLEIQN